MAYLSLQNLSKRPEKKITRAESHVRFKNLPLYQLNVDIDKEKFIFARTHVQAFPDFRCKKSWKWLSVFLQKLDPLLT